MSFSLSFVSTFPSPAAVTLHISLYMPGLPASIRRALTSVTSMEICSTLYISNHMALICQNCGTVNQDPGGDPRVYRCGVCGQQRLQRTLSEQDKRRLVSAIAGASMLG